MQEAGLEELSQFWLRERERLMTRRTGHETSPLLDLREAYNEFASGDSAMSTLRLFAAEPNIPTTTAWYLADLGEARGKQELFTKQSPQRLKVLREHTLIESAVSSSRIEGVTVDQSRIGTVIFGKISFARHRRTRGARLPQCAKTDPSRRSEACCFRRDNSASASAESRQQRRCRPIQTKRQRDHREVSRRRVRVRFKRHLGKWLSWSKPGSIVSKKIGFTL